MPPSPRTRFSNPRCYLNSSFDCSLEMSREHYISASVIRALGGQFKISGLPWQQAGQDQEIGINSLTSKVLCARHNAAFSPTDASAKRFFGIMFSIIANLSRRDRDPCGTEWYLVSGEMLELWSMKTLFGLYPKIAAKNRMRLSSTQTISADRLRRVIRRGGLLPPDGLYLRIPARQAGTYEPKMQLSPLSVFDQEVIGLRWSIFGVEFDFVFNSSNANMKRLVPDCIYRPGLLRLKKGNKCHAVAMTWPKSATADRELSSTSQPTSALEPEPYRCCSTGNAHSQKRSCCTSQN